jgi:hypothetical protein
MPGIFDNLLNLGAAYTQHVGAVKRALALPEDQAVASLSSYAQGLSDASFLGFKLTVGGLVGAEQNTSVKQSLQWIVENADALRSGRLAAAAPTAPAPEPRPPLASAPARGTAGSHIAGTWAGKMRDEAGEESEAAFRFSEAGNLLYGYNDQRGSHEVELVQAGQRIQFVPPGGGVTTIEFEEVFGSEQEAGYTARSSKQRVSRSGVMDQGFDRVSFHAKLQANGLAVVYESVGQKYTSGSGMMVGGDRAYRARGVLSKK